jgi:hypothetical protein
MALRPGVVNGIEGLDRKTHRRRTSGVPWSRLTHPARVTDVGMTGTGKIGAM